LKDLFKTSEISGVALTACSNCSTVAGSKWCSYRHSENVPVPTLLFLLSKTSNLY